MKDKLGIGEMIQSLRKDMEAFPDHRTGQGAEPADGIHSNRRVEQQDSPGKWVEQT